MAKDLFETKEYKLTQFYGGNKGICLQITPVNPEHKNKYGEWIELTKEDVLELINQLRKWIKNISSVHCKFISSEED